MMEYIVFFILLLFIAVLFYKQANESFEILQITSDRLSELPTMYHDRSPIVVTDFPTPNLGTQEEMMKRPTIPIGHLPTDCLSPSAAAAASRESGLQVWFEHHLYSSILPSPYTSFLYTFNTSLWPNCHGLSKTTAFQTVLMPTQGTAVVSILLPKMIPYLPQVWKGRLFSSFTIQDTPLLNQIQFIEIKIRKGNLLFLPAHLLFDIRSEADKLNSWVCKAEIHHPISFFAS